MLNIMCGADAAYILGSSWHREVLGKELTSFNYQFELYSSKFYVVRLMSLLFAQVPL